MPVKQKPDPKIVKVAAKGLPKSQPAKAKAAKKPTITQRMDARILDDQRNAPEPHKPAKKKAAPKKTAKK
jgi:hypothetical protein